MLYLLSSCFFKWNDSVDKKACNDVAEELIGASDLFADLAVQARSSADRATKLADKLAMLKSSTVVQSGTGSCIALLAAAPGLVPAMRRDRVAVVVDAWKRFI